MLKDKLEAAEKKLEEAFRSSDLPIIPRDSEGLETRPKSHKVTTNCKKRSVPDFGNLARLVGAILIFILIRLVIRLLYSKTEIRWEVLVTPTLTSHLISDSERSSLGEVTSRASNSFLSDLFHQLWAERRTGANILISPHSVFSALSLLHLGARQSPPLSLVGVRLRDCALIG